jgi:LmbE family N-acetylglucosaminyl deacetylase
MKLSQKKHSLYVPDSMEIESALTRTTHLGIGAHQDDLEFMALHGILECFQKKDQWFGAITCTDGAGSARTGDYADFSDEQMQAVRVEEQNTAARIGQYSFMAQLGHPSASTKKADSRGQLAADIAAVLKAAKPDVIYTHNPFDKHATHIGVLMATLDAIHSLAPEERPKIIYGCEVWRALDWLPDSIKVVHDVSAHPNLASALNGVFDSQIAGGKRYDLAVEGRRMANATFFDSHSIDHSDRVQYAIDISELIHSEKNINDFVHDKLTMLGNEIHEQLYTLNLSS